MKRKLSMMVIFAMIMSWFSPVLSIEIVHGESLPGPRAVYGGLSDTELFLGGNYIELGISNWGDFGTEGNKPEGFFGTSVRDKIGMSADHDGFGIGHDLAVDYYLPGTEEERFAVGYKIGEDFYSNSNSALRESKNMATTVENLSELDKDLLKAKIISIWEETMEITQIISFNTNDKFYRNEVTVKNISFDSWESARYMRSLDPDNTVDQGGSFATYNTVTHTYAEDGKAVVKAETAQSGALWEAFSSTAPLLFYSNDPRAKASVFGFANTDPYVADAYDDPKAKGETVHGDTGITMTWDSGPLLSGESKSFVYYTSLDERDFSDVQEEIIVADIHRDIEGIEDMDDVRDVKDKIDREADLGEEKKQGLKAYLFDNVCEWPHGEILVRDNRDILLLTSLIDESNKDEAEKDDARVKLIKKAVEDIGEDSLTETDLEVLEDIVNDISDEEKRAEAQSLLPNREDLPIEVYEPIKTPINETTVGIIVNGQHQTAGKEIVTEEKGQKFVEIKMDVSAISAKIDELLGGSSGAGQQSENLVEIHVTTKGASQIKSILTGDIVKKMADNEFTVAIVTEGIKYVLPAKGLSIEKTARALNVSLNELQAVEFEIKLNKVSDEKVAEITENALKNGYQMLRSPLQFTVVAKTNEAGIEKVVSISQFSDYVARVLEIPATVDLAGMATGVVYNVDGTFFHIPTEIVKESETWYAKLNSLTNSIYTVIWNSVTVEAVTNHWSKDAVYDMASRLIIKNPKSFAPDEFITRGEFTEYITKALGIYRNGTVKESKFTDVHLSDESADAITIAAEYGIIKGYSDGTFQANRKITREEAMVMYARAMDIVGLEEALNHRIKSYKDRDKISKWAYDDVQKTVSVGIFNGKTDTTINPQDIFTYAEAATAIRNLLIKGQLINK